MVQVQSLAWEFLHAVGAAKKKKMWLKNVVLILDTQHLFSDNSKDCVFGKDCSFFIFLTNVLREGKDKSECH